MFTTLRKKTLTRDKIRPLATKRLLGVLAHPGDEGFISGALLHYQAQGAETGLIYLTRGEAVGKSSNTAEAGDRLGQIREMETRAATGLLHVEHLWFLNYRDSGEVGSSDNAHPQALLQASQDHVVEQVVTIIRHFRPQVVIALAPHAGYGHPDHAVLFKHATQAFHEASLEQHRCASEQTHSTEKLYYASFAHSQLKLITEWLHIEALDRLAEKLENDQPGFFNEQISVHLNVEQWQERKASSWSQHLTQAYSPNLLTFLPTPLRKIWQSMEYYQLGISNVGPDKPGENNLFAHVF